MTAHTSDEVANPVTGQRIRFLRTGAQTGGDLLEMESDYRPRGRPPALHLHPSQRERFEVLTGTLRVALDGEERDLRPGEVLWIEPGQVHEMWNPGDEWTRVNWQVRPALRTEAFFRTVFGLAESGRRSRRGRPNLLQVSVLARAYDWEFRLAAPPRPVQLVLFGLLAPLGRLLGYGAHPDRRAALDHGARNVPDRTA